MNMWFAENLGVLNEFCVAEVKVEKGKQEI